MLENRRPISTTLVLVCFYMFLVIERPWESVRYLQGIPLERFYALALIIVVFLRGRLKIVPSNTNKWVYGLLALHFLLAPFAFNSGFAVDQGIEYAKMVVLYALMLAVVEDEENLKFIIMAYAFSTMFYVMHSCLEYYNGRHLFRMGISRMMGADSTFNDPNSFGATVILSLPFIYALLRTEMKKSMRIIYYLYFVVAVICVVLTGSRTSFAALLVLCILWVIGQHGKRKIIISLTVLLAMAIVWNAMPLEKQVRFRSLWDEDAGPESARQSAEGRMAGWKASWRMFKEHPLTGVGAGGENYIGYRLTHNVDDGHPTANQSHVLYGEVLAELGGAGAFFFLGLIVSIFRSCYRVRAKCKRKGEENSFKANLAAAIMATLFLLLTFGIGGHNFYRPLWLWLAAWSGALSMLTSERTNEQG